MSRVAKLLQDLQLEAYLDAFIGNDIDDTVLHGLSSDDLKELGVTSLGHRKKILDAIAALGAAAQAPVGTEPSVPAPAETPTEQRREVAVVFADLTGYTRLTNRLAVEDMHAILAGFFDRFDSIVRRLGGTVDRHIGDCVMAVFGAPVSYGNDAERALRASIEMHSAMRDLSRIHGEPLSTHIGIAMGRVLYSSKGQGSLAESGFTVTGSTINLASRLSDSAAGTETLISDRTYMEMRGQIDAEPVEEVEAKGFADKVKAFRLVGFKSARAQPDFVGRAAELSLAQAALASSSDKGTGTVIYLSGEAGIGKTSLLEQIILRATGMAFRVHRMLVLDFGLGEGQTLARSLLAQLTGLDENATVSAVEKAGQQLVADGVLDEKSIHVFARAMGVRPEGAALLYLKTLDDAALSGAQAEVIAAVVANRAKSAPLLLAVEDIHWADDEASGLVGRLAQVTANLPIVLVLTARPMDDEQDKALMRYLPDAHALRFDLAPLTPDEALELANRLHAPRADQVRKCLEKAEGNPLFLAQLLRHASEAGDDEVPGTIQSLVQAKIDRLSADDRRVLTAAAVIGQKFRIEAAMAVVGIGAYDLRPLADAGLIREFDDELLFSHALIRDGVYQTILRKELQQLHAGAAEWFRTTDSLLHAEHLEIAASPLAPAAFLRAARDAAASHRLTIAASLLERGLSLDPPPDVRVGILLFLGDVLRDLGRGTDSMKAFGDAHAQTTVPEEVVEAQIGLVGTMRIMDRLDGALPLIAEAIGTAERSGRTEQLSRLHYLKGSICFPKGDFLTCLEAHTRALDYAGQAGSPELEARALSGLGDAYYAQGRMFRAHEVFEKCLELCTRHGLVAVEAANRFMLGTAKIYLNQTEAALVEAQRSVSLAKEAGLLRPEIVSRLTAGWILQSLERSAEALAEVEKGIGAARALGAKRFEPFLRETAIRAHLSEGRREEAKAVADEVVAQARELDAMRFIGPWVLATASMADPDPSTAGMLLDEGDALLASGCVGHNYYRFYAYGIVGCLDRAETARARCYADALAAYTAAEPAPWSDFFIAFGRSASDLADGVHDAQDRLVALEAQAGKAGLLIAKRRIVKLLEQGRITPEET